MVPAKRAAFGPAELSLQREERTMSDETPPIGAMRMAFWSWMGIVVVGLAVMIALPLAGR